MAEYIKVSTPGIRQGKELILEEMKGFSSDIEELQREMQELGQTWEGPAWETFQAQLGEDMQNMREICEKMYVFIRHIEYAEKQYERCDGEVRQIINSIRI